MSDNIDKARAFLDRLKANPAMKGLNAMQVEDQLLQFLQVNGAKLYPTLSSPAFFAGYTPQQIYQILISTLKDMTNQKIKEDFDAWINRDLSMHFLRHLEYTRDSAPLRESIKNLLDKMLSMEISRRNMVGPYTAIKSGLIDRYIEITLERQRYTAFEFRKIQRLKMSPEEIIAYVKYTALLRPAVTLFIADKEGSGPYQNAALITGVYGEKVKENLLKMLPQAPMALIASVVNSWVSFQESNLLEATSRLAGIFSHRGVTYRQNMVIDRGAEGSDKSWFGIARKNYKFMGFDLDMIVELYNLASENGW